MVGSGSPTLHLIKLAVGVRDLTHLRALQADRARREPPLRHRTRNTPRRAAEILAGGSMFWVIGGALSARQLIIDIREETGADGARCAGLVLDPEVIPVRGRLMKPFQGWRYLSGADAPEDAATRTVAGDALPPTLRRQLEALCLL